MTEETPEVLLFLFLTGSDRQAVEGTVRAALSQFARSHYLAVFDVDKFPQLADRYQVAATPTLIFDDLVQGERRTLIGMPGLNEINLFLRTAKKKRALRSV